MKQKPYTVLLLRPDYIAATFGHDTFCCAQTDISLTTRTEQVE